MAGRRRRHLPSRAPRAGEAAGPQGSPGLGPGGEGRAPPGRGRHLPAEPPRLRAAPAAGGTGPGAAAVGQGREENPPGEEQTALLRRGRRLGHGVGELGRCGCMVPAQVSRFLQGEASCWLFFRAGRGDAARGQP